MPRKFNFHMLIFIVGLTLLFSCESSEEKKKRSELENPPFSFGDFQFVLFSSK